MGGEADGHGANGGSGGLITAHRALLERWRKAMNLVGPGPIDGHYDDSDKALAWLAPTGRWVDLGTGAGFPGVVFAARFPGVRLELVDSREKRCRFLEEVFAAAPSPGVTVRCMRHEGLPASAYDGVMSRALHAPEEMLDVGRRLLVPGGTLVLFLQRDAPIPEAADYEVFHVEHYEAEGRARKSAGLRWRG